jgi:membrane protein DedA with SNARE-associated domain
LAGVPGFITQLGWWAVFIFLIGVLFFRAQGTYWLGRWARKGADATAASTNPRAASIARRLSGPGADSARRYLERWGFLGIPASFLTVGFQTMVNAFAGFIRMRWDLYTVAMIPGCIAGAAVYTLVSFSLVKAWARSPGWVVVGILVLSGLIVAAFSVTRRRRTVDSAVRILQ